MGQFFLYGYSEMLITLEKSHFKCNFHETWSEELF